MQNSLSNCNLAKEMSEKLKKKKRLDLLIMENVLIKVKLGRKCIQAFDSKRNWKTRCQKLR